MKGNLIFWKWQLVKKKEKGAEDLALADALSEGCVDETPPLIVVRHNAGALVHSWDPLSPQRLHILFTSCF